MGLCMYLTNPVFSFATRLNGRHIPAHYVTLPRCLTTFLCFMVRSIDIATSSGVNTISSPIHPSLLFRTSAQLSPRNMGKTYLGLYDAFNLPSFTRDRGGDQSAKIAVTSAKHTRRADHEPWGRNGHEHLCI